MEVAARCVVSSLTLVGQAAGTMASQDVSGEVEEESGVLFPFAAGDINCRRSRFVSKYEWQQFSCFSFVYSLSV